MKMFRPTVVVSMLAVTGSGFSFLNQLVLARYFGTGSQMDTYLVAISLPLTVSALVVALLGYQLVPALLGAEPSLGREGALLRSLAWGLGGIAVIVAVAGAGLAGWIVPILDPGLSVPQYFQTERLARIAWMCLPLAVLAAIYTAGLHIRQRFAGAALLASAPMTGSLVFCLLAHGSLGVSAAVWGQLAGYLVMPIVLRLALGCQGPGHDWARLRKILVDLPVAFAALLVFVIFPFSDAIWGSRLGPGTVSYLGYAQRLLIGFSGVAITGASTVLFPRLARHAAAGRSQALLKELGLSLRMILVFMVPAATVFCVLAPLTVRVLFQRGAFHDEDAAAVGVLLRPMLAGVVAMSCAGLIFKALFARGNLSAAAALSLTGTIAYWAFSGLFGHIFGFVGIGIAYAVSWCLVLSLGLRYLWPAGLPARNCRFIVRVATASLLIGVACGLAIRSFRSAVSPGPPGLLVFVVGTWLAAAVLYVIAGNTILATEEMQILTRRAWRMLRRA